MFLLPGKEVGAQSLDNALTLVQDLGFEGTGGVCLSQPCRILLGLFRLHL